MSKTAALLLLVLAALLETGGDALVRSGLHAGDGRWRIALIVLGGVVLTSYGLVVNAPPWDFGRLLGVYVVLFFLAAQLMNLLVFRTPPSPPVLIGGLLIAAGGVVMSVAR
ncbi:hypothetical protein [Phenylobacterium soli]|uniref:Small multidrug resistance family-3 protein n=1 Tax=Phenylobacterium soli TaxID=2170551 RepID=A0A328AJZ4_9CAUL|nr:hypothetical protein [Phenylobacterium soli]RAK54919.1 hypothetical protein DJ017_10455 [Phenylobacterium soli]